ncbi:hypothetical protein [Burkholderia sp. AU38729]|uniref:hypothetical protein n=1 Tax=Burkholderia sp. AU38729 TaxID=2879633 RepID=UPI001CF19E83|nr:hypothetical protein [Burkholderia sp. AU38729]MCA8061265.1 hypothetical protein [Burkholderia sp. AU38729]
MGNLYKSTLKSGSIMNGHYRHSDAFQIIKSTKESSINNGKYLDIEYNQAYASVHSNRVTTNDPDKVFHENRMRERAHLDFIKELISLLSIVTNQYFDLDFDGTKNIRPSDQEEIEKFSDTSSSPEIRKDPYRVAQKQNFTMSFVSIHPDADIFFKNYFKLNFEARSRYNASIFLYQSMRKIFLTSASMAIVGLISAIENLMDFESKKLDKKPAQCQQCSQPIFSISKRFKEFMLKFSEFDANNPNSLLNKFYSKRSSISHLGGILEIDRLLSRFSMAEHREFTEIETHVRIALFNYLLKYDFGNEAMATPRDECANPAKKG